MFRRLFGLLFLVLGLALGLQGCGSSSESPVTGGAVGQVASADSVEGFVFQVNPVFIVANALSSPPGSQPRANAMVTAVNSSGNVVGMSLTNAQGRFAFRNLPTGSFQIQARLDPNSGAANATASVTTAAGGTVQANANMPVDRDQAIQLARQRVGFPTDSLVTCTLNPFPAGTEIRPAQVVEERPDLAVLTRKLDSDSWFLMIDGQPAKRFSHPVTYAFVNALTGEVSSLQCDYYPLVNSQPLWASKRELFDYTGVTDEANSPVAPPLPVVVSHPASSALNRLVDEPSVETLLGRHNVSDDSVFALLVAGNDEREMEADCNRVKKRLEDQGMPADNIRTVFVKSLTEDAALDSVIKALAELNAKIDERFARDEHSTLIYYHSSHGTASGVDFTSEGIFTKRQLLGPGLPGRKNLEILKLTRACRVRLIFDACKSGGFLDNLLRFLKDDVTFKQNVVMYSSTDEKTDSSYRANWQGFLFEVGGVYTNALSNQLKIENGDVTGLARLTPPPPEVLSPLKDIVQIGVIGFRASQNPQVRVFEGDPDAICPHPNADPPPVREVPEDKKTVFEFQNLTDDAVSVLLESDNQQLNGGQKINLAPRGRDGSTFRQEFTGPVINLRPMEFKDPRAEQIRDIGMRTTIPTGSKALFQWSQFGGTRTLGLTLGN